jgi:hypothetical protein
LRIKRWKRVLHLAPVADLILGRHQRLPLQAHDDDAAVLLLALEGAAPALVEDLVHRLQLQLRL